jgi:hypothetical protein
MSCLGVLYNIKYSISPCCVNWRVFYDTTQHSRCLSRAFLLLNRNSGCSHRVRGMVLAQRLPQPPPSHIMIMIQASAAGGASGLAPLPAGVPQAWLPYLLDRTLTRQSGCPEKARRPGSARAAAPVGGCVLPIEGL